MDTLTIGIILAGFYWLWTYLRRGHVLFQKFGIPYVTGWPVLGNMAGPSLGFQHQSSVIKEIYNCNRQAKYVGAFDFSKPVIVVRDPELIKKITIKNFEYFTDHQDVVDFKVDPLFGGNLLSLKGDRWREVRNLLSPVFTSSKMRFMFDQMVKYAENLVKHVDNQPQGTRFNSKDLFSRYTSDVIASCAFGLDVDSLMEPNNEFYALGRDVSDFEGLLSYKFLVCRGMPTLARLFRIKLFPKRAEEFYENLVKSIVEMRKQKDIRRPDMIQIMMDRVGKASGSVELDQTEMTAQAFDFFFAGSELNSRQMCILAHELTLNPLVQKRLQEEIDAVLAETKGRPTYEAINNMAYLDAVLSESLRKHPLDDLIDRVCTKEYELPPTLPGSKAFAVKPGTIVWIPLAGINYDPDHFDEPDAFRPERFLHRKLTLLDSLGFGTGPRMCIAARFATLEIKVLLFHLLSRFDLKPKDNRTERFEYVKSCLSIVPRGGYWFVVERRNNETNVAG